MDYPAQSESLFAQMLTTLERKMPMTARLNGKQEITKRYWKKGGELEK